MMTRGCSGLLLLFAAAATACSAPVTLASGALTAQACGFPAEARQKGIDSAVVTLQVSVNALGIAVGARILEDPGNGFGQAAVRCAMEQAYNPALDSHGTPYATVTPPLHVRFTR